MSQTDTLSNATSATTDGRVRTVASMPIDTDVLELTLRLWGYRYVVVLITVCCMALAFFYSFVIATPMYSSSALARPVPESRLADLNEHRTEPLSPEDALAMVVFEARAADAQRAVFERNKDGLLKNGPSSDRSDVELFVESFRPLVLVSVSNGSDQEELSQRKLTVRFEHFSASYAADMANAILARAHERAREGLLDDLRASIRAQIDVLTATLQRKDIAMQLYSQDRIVRIQEADRLKRLDLEERRATLIAKAEAQVVDRITQLKEALSIAQALGLDESQGLTVTTSGNANPTAKAAKEVTSISLAVDREQEYLKGTKVLKAELDALKTRESTEAFIPEIREIDAELSLLESNNQVRVLQERKDNLPFAEDIEPLRSEIYRLETLLTRSYENLNLMQVDQAATPPRVPIKPRRAAIIAAATVAGVILGVLFGLVMSAFDKRREAQTS